MPSPTLANHYQWKDAFNRRFWDESYVFDRCNTNTLATLKTGGAAAGGAEVDVIRTRWNQFEQFVIVGNTNITPQVDSTGFGLNFAPDAVNTHGLEFDWGITAANPYTTTTGTTPAVFFKMEWKVATVTGADVVIGFRKLAARNADMTTYSDYAVIGLIGGVGGKIKTQTNLASAGAVTTDTTQVVTNASVWSVAVFIDGSGNVTYNLNGAAPTVTAAFAFNPGTIVMPFFRVVQNATTTASALADWLEFGTQS